jgi:WD40 repeat protein
MSSGLLLLLVVLFAVDIDVAFSPDGTQALIASIGNNPSALVDLATGEIIHTLFASLTTGVAFTPDGQYAITAGNRLSLWDLTTGEEVRRYSESGFYMAPSMHTNGDSFYVNDAQAATIRHYRIDSDEALLAWTQANRYIRDLTCTERETYQITPYCE